MKYKPFIAWLLCLLLLPGFTWSDRHPELANFLEKQRTLSPTADSYKNSSTVLEKGNRVEILEFKKLPSGTFGIHIKIVGGPRANENFWVEHKAEDSALSLYESSPDSWKVGGTARRTFDVNKARGGFLNKNMEAIFQEANVKKEEPKTEAMEATTKKQDTKPRKAPSADAESKAKSTANSIDPKKAIELISQSNLTLRKAGEPKCVNCSIAPVSGEETLLRPRTTRGVSRACSKLMDSSGHLGPTGKNIFSIMAEAKYARYFTSNNSLGGFCKNFNNLTDAQKLQAWTWFWTALAQEESGCIENRKHETTYIGYDGLTHTLNRYEGHGLWTLERNPNVRRRNKRGAACEKIKTAEDQARCSIDIMVKTQLAKGRPARIRSESYWGPIHYGEKKLMPHMRRLKTCF